MSAKIPTVGKKVAVSVEDPARDRLVAELPPPQLRLLPWDERQDDANVAAFLRAYRAFFSLQRDLESSRDRRRRLLKTSAGSAT